MKNSVLLNFALFLALISTSLCAYSVSAHNLSSTRIGVPDHFIAVNGASYTLAMKKDSSWTLRVRIVQDASCYGIGDGILEAWVEGKTDRYTFKWNTNEAGDGPIAYHLTPGKYVVSAKDSKGRTQRAEVILKPKRTIDFQVTLLEDASYVQGKGGTAIVELINPGKGEHKIHWHTLPQSNGLIAENLAPGIHHVTVQDSEGCEATNAITLIDLSNTGNLQGQRNNPYPLTKATLMRNNLVNLQVYPNPSRGEFYLEAPAYFQDITSVNMTDMDGKVVYSANTLKDRVHQLSASSLPGGTYLVRIENALGQSIMERVVIE